MDATEKSDKHPDTKSVASTLEDMYADGAVDPLYQQKARILNSAIQEIGMGRYQYYLFVVAGFGWFAYLITGLILTSVTYEFEIDGPFLTLAANIGLLVGAMFWGFGCDVFGTWAFNLTLLIAGVFGLAAGGSPNFVTLASLLAVVGVGVGGNMPVDAAVFLDLVPGTYQWMLTAMSVFWSLGQLLCSLVAWPLIVNFTCPSSDGCERSNNEGWRYLLFTLGGLTLVLWGIRFFIFDLLESPRYLVGMGKDAEAVAVIHKLAKYNSTSTTLSVDTLAVAGGGAMQQEQTLEHKPILSRTAVLRTDHVKALFLTPKMALSTTLLIGLWAIIGLASTLYNSFLPYLLESRGNAYGDGSLYITYRNYCILSVIGVPSAFFAGWAVELPYIGRRGALAISSGNSNALLGWNCGYTISSNTMYGVLYAVSPETFPAKYRGTGNALVSSATRVFGVIAPIIALYANINTAVPVYISGALIIGAGGLSLFLPYEPRGKASI
ncbi:MFS general substrate transporter [Fistulina hepatica ATCC 64428]|nr:MFS general substrate transporter [Fistulina hepatica ATCC 64428]